MARARSPNRSIAMKMYLDVGGDIVLKDIAADLGVKDTQIRKWKSIDKWDEQLKLIPVTYKKQPNADVSKSKGNVTIKNKKKVSPKAAVAIANTKAVKHGLFAKYLPQEVYDIVETLKAEDIGPIEILYNNILLTYANILRAQKILYVDDIEDMSKEIEATATGDMVDSTKYQLQYAWDKQSKALASISQAQTTLNNMIKHYVDLINGLVDARRDEYMAKIAKIKAEVDKIDSTKQDTVINYISNIPQPEYSEDAQEISADKS